jgi:type III pantothenate kinase
MPSSDNDATSSDLDLLLLHVGNTRAQLGLCLDGAIKESTTLHWDEPAPLIEQAVTWWNQIRESASPAILLASVNEAAGAKLAAMLKEQLGAPIYRIEEDLPIPIGRQLHPETMTGVDRLLNAAAAWDALEQACVIVDAGTAVTVDFVDGQGTFHGGAIAPGAAMQLQSLHEGTDALPELAFQISDESTPFGRSTSEAMQLGVYNSIKGLVTRMVELFATAYGAYPQVIVTGGNGQMIFADDELIDRIVPHLAMQGMIITALSSLSATADGINEDMDA